MAKTKQFTISIENHPGAVAEIARTLGTAKVNILALLGTAQGTTGTVELVVEDARRARKALDDAKLTYKETTAVGVRVAQQARGSGRVFGQARRQRRQLEFDLRHRLERREESRCGLHGSGRRESGNRSLRDTHHDSVVGESRRSPA